MQAQWNDKNTTAMFEILLEKKLQGVQSDNRFKDKILKNIANQLACKFLKSNIMLLTQVRNQMNSYKMQYKEYKELVADSGLGLDLYEVGSNKITADDNVWDTLEQARPCVEQYGFRQHEFPLFELIDSIFTGTCYEYDVMNISTTRRTPIETTRTTTLPSKPSFSRCAGA